MISSLVHHVRLDDGLIERAETYCLSFDTLHIDKILLCFDLPTLYQFDIAKHCLIFLLLCVLEILFPKLSATECCIEICIKPFLKM